MRFLLIVLLGISTSFAGEDIPPSLVTPVQATVVAQCPVDASTMGKMQLARSGCCSHHHGVCGCTGGRQQCCDGTLSPSCTCNKEDARVPD